ncbi:hypothetical protein DDZ14_02690 [Maritimibacter sp. 55A14]|uniref:DUF995 domain-containing protein n=1 Tax=Maritimibacter sp. 55A14 TaxID=2174844 RepID=UPI000D61B41C|nr:DUF995 domain-containing protein [Maritimibacter sp. 55A14]PWE34141.1 hypothetical protein DDZ14_02690 [Maritimibacter sp. 55A14]
MRTSNIALSGFGIIALCTSVALAGGKPEGAKPTNPKKIYKLFAGKTSNWNRGGYAFWGPKGELQATGKSGSVGVGKWYVTTSSKLCQEATYYWTENAVRKSEVGKWCWQFVTAPDGTIYEKYLPENTDWYPYDKRKQVKGNMHGREYQKLLRKFGL